VTSCDQEFTHDRQDLELKTEVKACFSYLNLALEVIPSAFDLSLEGKKVFLVDCHELNVEGVKWKDVIGIIDHR